MAQGEIGGHEVDLEPRSRHDGLLERKTLRPHGPGAPAELVVYSERVGRTSLWSEVYDQGSQTSDRGLRREIDGGRCLADAAFDAE